jgi:hypothetical protein
LGRKGWELHYEVSCNYLVWHEKTKYVLNAIDREKQIKDSTRIKKEALITGANPDWTFFNEGIVGNWPPTEAQVAEVRERWVLEREGRILDKLSFNRGR